MPVLLLSDVFPPRHGGSGRWMWELYRRLPASEPSVVAGHGSGEDAFDRSAPFPIARWEAFPSWGLTSPAGFGGYWQGVRTARSALRRSGAQVIHCAKSLPEGLIGLMARGARSHPVICFAHGEELTLARTSRELKWLTAFVLGRASRIVANSHHTSGLLTNDWHVDPGKIAVLTPGVDTERFTPAPPDAAARARLGWAGRRVILTVGALQKRKGQDMLIRALPAIRERCPDVLYAIAGEGWEQDDLVALAQSLGVANSVQFVGAPDDNRLVELYQQCDLFALPNRQVGWDIEGFGIVLLEAQASGKPVIAGASGGTAETMQPGVTGEIVQCDSPEPLARTCADLVADEPRRERFGRAARSWVVQHFDWGVLALRAAELFRYP